MENIKKPKRLSLLQDKTAVCFTGLNRLPCSFSQEIWCFECIRLFLAEVKYFQEAVNLESHWGRKKSPAEEKVQTHNRGNLSKQVQVLIFRKVWEGRHPYGAASHSTQHGLQKEGRCLQHLSFSAKYLFFVMVLKGSNTNRAASHWDCTLSRKVAMFLSQHCRCAYTKPCKPYLLTSNKHSQFCQPKGKAKWEKRQDEKTLPPIQVIKHVSIPTRNHSSALLISF